MIVCRVESQMARTANDVRIAAGNGNRVYIGVGCARFQCVGIARIADIITARALDGIAASFGRNREGSGIGFGIRLDDVSANRDINFVANGIQCGQATVESDIVVFADNQIIAIGDFFGTRHFFVAAHAPVPVRVPNHAGVFRMVDEGVAIVLVVAVNDIVAIDFLLANRVVVAPIQQHLNGPRQDFRLVGHAACAPIVVLGIIAHAHIHHGAGKVALVFIDWLENGTNIAQGRLASA